MKVKIGNTLYDSKDQPIMVILSEQDKENIKNMMSEMHKYCCYPDNMKIEDIYKFMSNK